MKNIERVTDYQCPNKHFRENMRYLGEMDGQITMFICDSCSLRMGFKVKRIQMYTHVDYDESGDDIYARIMLESHEVASFVTTKKKGQNTKQYLHALAKRFDYLYEGLNECEEDALRGMYFKDEQELNEFINSLPNGHSYFDDWYEASMSALLNYNPAWECDTTDIILAGEPTKIRIYQKDYVIKFKIL